MIGPFFFLVMRFFFFGGGGGVEENMLSGENGVVVGFCFSVEGDLCWD